MNGESRDRFVRAEDGWRITGTVLHGAGKGRTVGMPTANLKAEGELPPLGVYASLVRLRGGTKPGVTNVGTRPTVDDRDDVTVETMILDFDGDLYGETVTVELKAWLRPISRMESLEAVRDQVAKDSLRARELLSGAQLSR